MILHIDPDGLSTIDFSRWAPTVNFHKTSTFPPKAGQWFRAPDGDVILGCLKCKNQYSVNPKYHKVLPNGDLQPSWTCVLCGSHTVVHLVGYEP